MAVERKIDGVWKAQYPWPEIQDRWYIEQYTKDGGVWPPAGYDPAAHVKGTPVDVPMVYWTDGRGETHESSYPGYLRSRWPCGRNYDAFAILGNVRNGEGFAGVETGSGFKFIAEMRGLPSDLAEELRAATLRDMYNDDVPDGVKEKWADEDYDADLDFDFGDHSFNHLLLSELNAFDWTQTTRHTGIVGWNEFREWYSRGATGGPRSWCGGVGGPNVRIVKQEEALEFLDPTQPDGYNPGLPGNRPSHVQMHWLESYADAAGAYYSVFLPALRELDPNPDNVRLSFGFDS